MMINYINNIEANPEIMFGKPCIKGTRVPVDLILEKLKGGYTYSDLLLERIDSVTNLLNKHQHFRFHFVYNKRFIECK